MERIITHVAEIPDSVRGFTLWDNVSYMIILNKNLSPEEQTKTLKHEMTHIIAGDFFSSIPVNQLELLRHN